VPALRRYADMNAALCPIPAGGKSPVGLISSFAHDHSKDPAQWAEWAARWPGCGWIMVAGPSSKIVVDIDVKKVGRAVAWQAWVDLCEANGSPVYKPHVQTPSQGWHIIFETTETDLRQPPLIPGIIDIRAGMGYVLIPPSHVDGVPYQSLLDGPA
jgi:Bifunctional DNA primase/polymerase, N-terminal